MVKSIPAAFGSAGEGLTRSLAVEMAPIRVNLIKPGAIDTELFDRIPMPKENLLAMFAKETLVGRVGAPEDVAEAYLYCMKDRFVTGTVIGSDGGRLLV